MRGSGGGGSGRSGTPWKIQISYLNLHSKITHNMLRIPPPSRANLNIPRNTPVKYSGSALDMLRRNRILNIHYLVLISLNFLVHA